MTRIEKLKYARRVLLVQDRLALRYQKLIRRELIAASKELALSYIAYESQIGFADVTKQHRDRLILILDKLSKETADAFKVFSIKDKKNTFETYIENAIYGILAKNSMTTASTVATNTVAVATSVIMQQMTLAKKDPTQAMPQNVANSIAQRIGGANANVRAMTIARTETHKAANTAQYTRAEWAANDAGLEVEVEWISTNDSRVRDSHKSADGQTRAIGEPFIVNGESMRWPSDPRGSASNVINCRCVLGYNVK